MLRVLILSCILVVGLAEPEVETVEVLEEPTATENHMFKQEESRNYEERPDYGARLAYATGAVHNQRQRIIENVFSPDYIEPTEVLDYRYLKSGGRDYTRGPGGQILILPRNVYSHEPKQHKDYDSMIEFLRLKNLQMQEAQRQRYQDMSYRNRHNMHSGREEDHDQHWH